MGIDVDHYTALGLPSGEEGSKLTDKEISKAYKLKALELHPDKRPDDPNAHAKFQKLKLSYEILKDENARKLFDDLLRAKREKDIRLSQRGAKRRKMMSELNEKERAASAADEDSVVKEVEERTHREFLEQVARVRAMHANRAPTPTVPASEQERAGMKENLIASKFPSAQQCTESDRLNNLVGAGYKEYEDRVLDKLKRRSRLRETETPTPKASD